MDSKIHSPPSPPPAYNQAMQNTDNEQQFGQSQQPQQQQQQHYQPPYQQNAFPMHQMPPTVVNEQMVSVIMSPQVGPDPQMITCPSCRASVITRMEYEPTTKTHIMAGLLCVFCCWCCVCVPYCVNSCKNGNHFCPSCGAFIGTYSS
ncbi:lipopolysaccharide-induced tumor necrosis factor-alpha factor homolog [Bradysia coprophila]|uniref:lipopolysaccharide-induced tumor necrosis factor-alpha factor homolog n=1 Tax=Bradysia coprophila TaxID=38358 RepID=UPI00187DC953|nr:lipopolysaccharide-induced tumor necrosis factor-alpha factor homolog [Bradysia coprophila]